VSDSIAVIIGAGGMGLAIARRLAPGRSILLADVNKDLLAEAVKSLGETGGPVASHLIDVSDADSVAALAAEAARLGAVTQLAHTAGLSPVQASAAAILRVDLLGVALVLDAFEKVMAPGGAGVVIASMAGHLMPLPPEQERALASTPTADLLDLPFLAPDVMSDPGMAYAVAKRANVLRVRASFAAWGARGARINSISPGVISTSMGEAELASSTGDVMRMMLDMSALKRKGTADDIAAAAAFLLGPDASYVTGTDLLVDGGVVAAVIGSQS
jgi:NAD(P)-dependent dehydrogenase (short-subunit alcohol dehydrogenase family)